MADKSAPTKKSQNVAQNKPATSNSNQQPVQKADSKQEASQAASASVEAQRKAKELTQAAGGAADPEERQKLLNEALQKEIEAESFGKTARYLQSGTFQGLLAGTGMGGGVGIGLGMAVGSVLAVPTGGIGAGLGAAGGALHGPFFNLSETMGEGMRKITGTIPGWKATWQQKQALEGMVNGVMEQDRPGEEELERMSAWDAEGARQQGQQAKEWSDSAAGYLPGKSSLPSMPSLGGGGGGGGQAAGSIASGGQGEGGVAKKDGSQVQRNANSSKQNGKPTDTANAKQSQRPVKADAKAKGPAPLGPTTSQVRPTDTTQAKPTSKPPTNPSPSAPNRSSPQPKQAQQQTSSRPANGQATKQKPAQTQTQPQQQQHLPKKQPPRKLEVRSSKAKT